VVSSAFPKIGIALFACRGASVQTEPGTAWHPAPMGEPTIVATTTEARACTGYDGAWHCPALKRPILFGASGSSSPIYPASWNVAAWYINPSTGSDSNSCTTSGAPCATWGEIAQHRWGTVSPFHSVNVAINWLAGQPSPGYDQVIYKPTLGVINGNDAGSETSMYVVMTGTMTAGSATTLTLTSSKARATNVRLRGTWSATPTVEQLLSNTTHPSYAWIPGINNDISQPITATTIVTNQFSTIGTEVDTWATSDSITPYTLPHVNLVDVEPTMACMQGQCGVTITHVLVPENIPAGTSPGDDQTIIGDSVQLVEDVFERQAILSSRRVNYIQPGTIINSAMIPGIITETNSFNPIASISGNELTSILAGYMYPQGPLAGTGTIQLTGTLLDYDVWIKATVSNPIFLHGNNYGCFVEFEGPVVVQNGVFDTTSTSCSGSTVWGNGGTLDSGNGQVLYKSGSGGAVASIPIANLKVGGGTVCQLDIPSSATPITGNQTISAANLDSSLGTTSGSCGDGIGGGFKNFGN
jgi:hypothetical protein